MKKLLVVLVVVVILAVMALHQQSRPVTATCGSVSGGQTMTVAGVGVAQKVTRWVRDHADVHKDGQQIKKAIDALWYKVLWYWIRTGFLSLRGEKIDPQILQLQQQQEAAASAARGACGQPCPPSGQQAPPDPASIPAKAGRATAERAAARYWSGRNLEIAVAIAGAESSFNPDPPHPPVVHGSTMRGLWQINEHPHRDLFRKHPNWRDPGTNAWMAHEIWLHAGKRWTDWSTYNSGSYRRYLRPVSHVAAAALRTAPPLNDSITPKAALPPQCTPSTSSGTPQTDTAAPTPDGWNHLNPRTVDGAIWFLHTREPSNDIPGFGIRGHCEGYMNRAYGFHGGYASARAHWNAPGTRHTTGVPPRGALVFWDTGGYGHVAMSLGGGRIISTDYNGHRYQAGVIGEGPIGDLDKWGRGRLGWRAPAFKGSANEGANA